MTDAREQERYHARALAKLRKARRAPAKKARPVSPKADRGRVRNNAYLAWLRRQPCAVGTLADKRACVGRANFISCEGKTQAAHIRSHKPGEMPTGLQRKPDDQRATPLCHLHHWEQHSMNEMQFWRNHGLDPFEVAAEHFARFEAQGARG